MSKITKASRELRDLRDLRIARSGDTPAGRRFLLPALFGAAFGAITAWLLDPDRGRSRRARLADQTAAIARRGIRLAERQQRMIGSLAAGKMSALRSQPDAETAANDATLKEKVESELLRDPKIPKGAININAEQGIVVLRGEVPDEAMREKLEKRASTIPGVWSVENLLHLPGEPAPTLR
jgi:gas vesicle protein